MATSIKGSWKAVVILPGDPACAAAGELSGKRFLARNAPRLPLTECTNQDGCTCKYRHHGDRRSDQRRAGAARVFIPTRTPGKEKRRPGERRERGR
jgi:hypothetical protein